MGNTGGVSEELRKLYEQAWAEGIWLYEYAPGPGGGKYLAAAGSIKALEEIEKRLGREIDIYQDLMFCDVVSLSMPGTGQTREEACRNAVAELQKHQLACQRRPCRFCP